MIAYAAIVFAFLLLRLTQANTEIYNVTLAVFSGREDPEWVVTLPKGQIIDMNTHDPSEMPRRLGYKGFIVQSGKTARLIVGLKTQKLQLQLLDTMPQDLLSRAFIEKIKSQINSGLVKADVSSERSARNAPPYAPNQWQGVHFVRRICNNCYNYANNRALNNYAQPGHNNFPMNYLELADMDEFTTALLTAAVADGLVLIHRDLNGHLPQDLGPAENSHVVALVVQPGQPEDRDFHWYRLDNNGRWSHKAGQSAPTDLDNGNATHPPQPILDPRTANRGAYTNFVAFMYSYPDVNLAGPPHVCCLLLARNALPCLF